MPRSTALRVEFTTQHDIYLYKYLARYCPSKEGRSGRKVYEQLVANEHNKWPWSVRHTPQSWRERYVRNADRFDRLILNHQQKGNTKPKEEQKRAAEPMPIELLGRSAKRVKLEAKKRVPSSETRTERDAAAQHASSNSSRSKLISKRPREHQESPSHVHPAGEPEPADVGPSSPPHPTNGTNTDATKKSSPNPPALQARHNTTKIPSSPNQPTPPPTDGEPGPRSPPRAAKRKERPRAPSVVFTSEPSSPGSPAAVNVGGAPVTDTVYPRAPPRIVDSLHGHVLVDRKGHVPHALPHREEEEEEEEEDKAQWPPPRGRTAKRKTEGGPAVEVNAHHAFSQPQPRSDAPLESVAMSEREQGKPCHPFEQVSQPFDGALPDRCTAAALFLAGQPHDVAPQVEGERREDVTRNGGSSVKRIVRTAPSVPPAPPSGLISNSKALKFPAPRASTRSPFRPEPPTGETRHPAPRPRSRTKAARHPALSHIRRQTIGHEHERARENRPVPSVDLVALSRSSTSGRSHSGSSAGPSVPARPSRWSLPTSACLPPWLIDEPEGAPSAPGPALRPGSPLRWGSSPVYADIWRHARRSSLGGTSSPRFTFTPSPGRSIAAVATNTNTNASAPHLNAIPVSPSFPISPHRPDVPLTASHGLASILARMSANHGLALGVVEAVYKRVRSLREADEVLRGMREAAEEFGEREIEKRVRGRHEEQRGRNGDAAEQTGTLSRYVVASEDGEGSEYSPPETSRAAMWKRQSESASYPEEGEKEADGEGGQGDRDDEEEEEAEGRAVEEELWEAEGEEGNENENGLPDKHHDFSQAFLGEMEAQELENKMGRRQFRKEVVRRFV